MLRSFFYIDLVYTALSIITPWHSEEKEVIKLNRNSLY